MAVEAYPNSSDLIGRQAAKSLATKEKIINAVIGIIKESGYSAASSTQIAKRAGVTWGAVQHHFGSKEAILAEVLEKSHLKFHEALSDDRFASGSADRRITKYIDAAWQHYQGEEYMAALEILLATRGHGKAEQDLSISGSRDAHIKLGRRIFHDSKATDKVLSEVIYVVHCMLTGILVESVLEPDSFSVKMYIRHLKNIAKDMLY